MTRPYRDERRYARCEARLGGGRRLQKTCRVCSPSRHDRAETLRAPDFSQIEPFTRRSIAASSMYRLTALHALRALPAFTQSFRARKHERNVTRAAYCLFWTEPRRTFLDRTETSLYLNWSCGQLHAPRLGTCFDTRALPTRRTRRTRDCQPTRGRRPSNDTQHTACSCGPVRTRPQGRSIRATPSSSPSTSASPRSRVP